MLDCTLRGRMTSSGANAAWSGIVFAPKKTFWAVRRSRRPNCVAVYVKPEIDSSMKSVKRPSCAASP
eukprot:5299290-Lingulodinium_polyedra.AAC.1